ncbi:MAG: response regulator [Desulfobacteraceae bacterium]|nr:response regulator [Desulfobacteraceae bacterium]
MQRKRVLIIEDEESLLKLLTVILTVNGFEVSGVSTGSEALEKLSNEAFDLILLDIMLPDINGYDICRRIKEHPLHASIPVVMLTAKKSAEDRELGSTCGAAAYLTKPFKSAIIIEVIEKLLGKGVKMEKNT